MIDQHFSVFASPPFDRAKPRFIVLEPFRVGSKLRDLGIAHRHSVDHRGAKHQQRATDTMASLAVAVAVRISHAGVGDARTT